MILSDKEILSVVCTQLAIDLNCSADDFSRDGFVFREAKENPGRRPFPRGERHFNMLTMGGAVIVSATPDILPYVREQLGGKNREEAFVMPFVHGTGHYFLPDNPRPLPVPKGIGIRIVERGDIAALYKHKGFTNAIGNDANHPRPDALAMTAKKDGVLAGIAGASTDGEMMWQIGIDVLPEYRNLGIATTLVNRLTLEILGRGKVPYYGTAPANVASQRVAYRAGLKPAWVCVYRGRFDDTLTEPTC